MPGIQSPYCLAMVLANSAYRDPVSGMFTILGTFNRIVGPEEPIQMQFCVYAAITDGLGQNVTRGLLWTMMNLSSLC